VRTKSKLIQISARTSEFSSWGIRNLDYAGRRRRESELLWERIYLGLVRSEGMNGQVLCVRNEAKCCNLTRKSTI